jgi:hypothetical protein
MEADKKERKKERERGDGIQANKPDRTSGGYAEEGELQRVQILYTEMTRRDLFTRRMCSPFVRSDRRSEAVEFSEVEKYPPTLSGS